MIKISKLFLFFLLSITSNQIHGMEHQSPIAHEISETTQTLMSIFHKELMEAIKNKNFETIKNLVEKAKKSKIDFNILISPQNKPLFYYVLADVLFMPSEFKLKVIEYLIQNEVDLNNTFLTDDMYEYTSLERVIYQICNINVTYLEAIHEDKLHIYYKLIVLLLCYGEKITDKAIELAKKNKRNEILKIFNHHELTLNQAKSNPTEELLIETIASNQPYIVRLIVQNKPELITAKNIEYAETKSPFSAKILNRILQELRFQKFRTSELGQRLPQELAQYIEQFVGFKK